MERTNLYIAQNNDGKIFAYASDYNEMSEYINKAIECGMMYAVEKNGIAFIYTFFKK